MSEHKIGDTVWIKTDKAYKTLTGKITGQTKTHHIVMHKDGTEKMYKKADNLLSKDFPYKNPNEKYESMEEAEKVDELSTKTLGNYIKKGLVDKKPRDLQVLRAALKLRDKKESTEKKAEK